MPTLYIMVGVGFAGKSTLAKAISDGFAIPLVSQDALYFEKHEELHLDGDSDEDWEMLLGMCKEKISGLLTSGQSVVFDNTNLKREHRDELRALADKAGARAVVVFLDTPETSLNERQEKNKVTAERHDVEQRHLDEAKRQLEIPTADEGAYVFTPTTGIAGFLASLPR